MSSFTGSFHEMKCQTHAFNAFVTCVLVCFHVFQLYNSLWFGFFKMTKPMCMTTASRNQPISTEKHDPAERSLAKWGILSSNILNSWILGKEWRASQKDDGNFTSNQPTVFFLVGDYFAREFFRGGGSSLPESWGSSISNNFGGKKVVQLWSQDMSRWFFRKTWGFLPQWNS